MLILKRTSAEQHCPSRIVALFGVGTVGGAVACRLTSQDWCVTQRIDTPWEQQEQLQHALAKVYEELTQRNQSQCDQSCSFIWSAGRAGFNATDCDAANEMSAFERVLHLFKTVRQRLPDSRWHQISSAGGLFEGQRLVGPTNQPAPKRPYGLLKLRQELALRDLPMCAHAIYRLTSVFAPTRRGQRCGLIPTMASNGVLGRITQIAGHSTTLRDFTWADDVASFVVDNFRIPPNPTHNTFLLASGRPVSIGEVQWMTEQSLRRHLYINYVTPQNDCDITFGADVMPRGFSGSDLRSCIRRVCQEFLAVPEQHSWPGDVCKTNITKTDPPRKAAR